MAFVSADESQKSSPSQSPFTLAAIHSKAQSMHFLPIEIKQVKNNEFLSNPACPVVIEAMQAYYKRIGFHKPWIGYFASIDGKELVGVAGYKGKPKDGKIEVAYGTFKEYEGQGIGTAICKHLVDLARQCDPDIRITARTFQDGHASMAILRKNGFQCLGIVWDEEDGDVFEWEFPKQPQTLAFSNMGI